MSRRLVSDLFLEITRVLFVLSAILSEFKIVQKLMAKGTKNLETKNEQRHRRNFFDSEPFLAKLRTNMKLYGSYYMKIIETLRSKYNYIIAQVILAFWLVLAYDLLKDIRAIDVIVTKFFPSCFKMAESFENLDNILRDWAKDKGQKILVKALNRFEKQKEER